MRITIVTDAWHPQVNGVVRSLEKTIEELIRRGHVVTVVHPGLFRAFPLPIYKEIPVAWNVWRVGAVIAASRPDSLHIAVEGTLGVAAKLWADRRGIAYTTSYHTQFPEYIDQHFGLGLRATYAGLRWFHGRSRLVMVNTPSMEDRLHARGFQRLVRWGRGVDTDLFRPDGPLPADLPEDWRDETPILLNVGRVSVEKNLPAFYELPSLLARKVQVGDGPMLEKYRRQYPDVLFVGKKTGEDLAAWYRAAKVFVFPSCSDTFGLVMLEAIASGVPVAAYPVLGPIDVVTQGVNGALFDDLGLAVFAASWLDDKSAVRETALPHSWTACTSEFEANLLPVDMRVAA